MDANDNHLPGRLEWRPAAEAPELLAAPTTAALGELEAYAAPIDPALADTAAFCEAYAVEPAASANCVIVEGRRGESTTLAAVLVLATDRADINKSVRKELGVRKISFAAQEKATSLTEMEYGGITPIGLPREWPILVDEAVTAAEWIVVGSGIRGSKVAMRGADAAGLPGARVLPLAQPTS